MCVCVCVFLRSRERSSPPELFCFSFTIFYFPWHQYVASLDCSLQGGSQFYYTTSDDMITWDPLQPLYSRANLPPDVAKNVTSMSYPTFMYHFSQPFCIPFPSSNPLFFSFFFSSSPFRDPASPALGDNNFGTIGQNPYLFWVSIGHSPYSDGRNVWATPFSFA